MITSKEPYLHQDWIDLHALGIVKALQKNGFTTYLVGGCVRDLLLGIRPKDFDIATSAKPNEVRRIIRHSYVIGKRFRLVLVKRDEQTFEVATFRKDVPEEEKTADMPEGDNVFGTPEEDATRRDFTINGLLYDPVKDKLIDYCSGLEDLKNGVVKMIGDPNVRLQEDPIRILRAIRLTHKIRFSLDSQLRKSIKDNAESLELSVLPRRREEYLKFLRLPNPSLAFLDCYDLGVLKHIAPHIHRTLHDPEKSEEFLRYLRHFHDQSVDRQNSTELFGLLVHAIFRCQVQPDPTVPVRSRELLEDPDLLALMKDELGMFKHEQTLVTKALQLLSLLARRKEFERKGSRRQMAILRNESFPLALKFAERDYFLSCEDLHFWSEKYHSAFKEIQAHRESQKKRRRRPRRKPKKAPQTGQ